MKDKVILSNGIRVLLDINKVSPTVAFGIWSQSGSAYEPNEKRGISHFIEHMTFKGTESYSAEEIAKRYDNMGGYLNAYTAKESTCYYAKTLSEDFYEGFSILSDMYLNSVFKDEDIQNEKKVILEEIAMEEDVPEDIVIEKLCSSVWKGSGIGENILGNKSTILSFTNDMLIDYRNQNYTSDNTVLAFSGDINRDELLLFLEERFADIGTLKSVNREINAEYKSSIVLSKKKIEQNHICIAFDSIKGNDLNLYYALSILNVIFGGSMSSKLFRRLREELGLVYSVCSFPMMHRNTSLFCIAAACNSKNEEKAIREIVNEIKNIKSNGISSEEIVRAKQQLKATVIMGLEGNSARVMHMGKNEVMHGRVTTPADIIETINGVDDLYINSIINSVFDFDKISLSIVGNTKSKTFYKNILI